MSKQSSQHECADRVRGGTSRKSKPYAIWSMLRRRGEWSRWGRYASRSIAEEALPKLQQNYGSVCDFEIRDET